MNKTLVTDNGLPIPEATSVHPSGVLINEPLPAIQTVLSLLEKVKLGDEAALNECTMTLIKISEAWSMRSAQYYLVKSDRDALRETCESLMERIDQMREHRDLPPPGPNVAPDTKPRGLVGRLFAGFGF